MNVLVTGGAGFIGSHLLVALSKRGYDVTVFDNLSINNYNIPLLKRLGIEIVVADVQDYQSVRDATENIDLIFHLAAMNRAPRSIENPLAAHEVNATGTLNVLESARENDVRKVIVASSSSVLTLTHPYAVGKLCGENYSKVYHELYGLETVVLRYFSIYGPRQDGTIEHAAVVPKFIHHLYHNIPLPIYGDGYQTRSFTYISDAVNATIKAAENKVAVGKMFNVGSEEEVSINQVVDLIEKYSNRTAERQYLDSKKGDPLRNPADITITKQILSYIPDFDIIKGISETIKWYESEFEQWRRIK